MTTPTIPDPEIDPLADSFSDLVNAIPSGPIRQLLFQIAIARIKIKRAKMNGRHLDDQEVRLWLPVFEAAQRLVAFYDAGVLGASYIRGRRDDVGISDSHTSSIT